MCFSHGARPKCTKASQPQSLAVFWIADKIAGNLHSEKQIWPFLIAKRIATAAASLPQKKIASYNLDELVGTTCSYSMWLTLQWNPQKNCCVQFWPRERIADFDRKSSPGNGAPRARRAVHQCCCWGGGSNWSWPVFPLVVIWTPVSEWTRLLSNIIIFVALLTTRTLEHGRWLSLWKWGTSDLKGCVNGTYSSGLFAYGSSFLLTVGEP